MEYNEIIGFCFDNSIILLITGSLKSNNSFLFTIYIPNIENESKIKCFGFFPIDGRKHNKDRNILMPNIYTINIFPIL
jgi:hypothetical protein